MVATLNCIDVYKMYNRGYSKDERMDYGKSKRVQAMSKGVMCDCEHGNRGYSRCHSTRKSWVGVNNRSLCGFYLAARSVVLFHW